MNELLIATLRKRGEKDITPVSNDGYILLRKGNGSPFDRNFIIEQESSKMSEVCVKLYFEYKNQPGSELRLIFLDNEKNLMLVNHMFFDSKLQVEIDFLNEEKIQLIPWINPAK